MRVYIPGSVLLVACARFDKVSRASAPLCLENVQSARILIGEYIALLAFASGTQALASAIAIERRS